MGWQDLDPTFAPPSPTGGLVRLWWHRAKRALYYTTSEGTSAPVASAGAAGVTSINGASGVVATSQLGSGVANSSTFLRGDATWAAASGGVTITAIEQDVSGGAGLPRAWGSFSVSDASVSATSKITIWQAAGPYTAKGVLADEADMDRIIATAYPAAGTFTVRWRVLGHTAMRLIAAGMGRPDLVEPVRVGVVKGNIKFQYIVG